METFCVHFNLEKEAAPDWRMRVGLCGWFEDKERNMGKIRNKISDMDWYLNEKGIYKFTFWVIIAIVILAVLAEAASNVKGRPTDQRPLQGQEDRGCLQGGLLLDL
ncbi:MAG: hypothetical protein WC526_04715 [Patescibacteria group bacterium]